MANSLSFELTLDRLLFRTCSRHSKKAHPSEFEVHWLLVGRLDISGHIWTSRNISGEKLEADRGRLRRGQSGEKSPLVQRSAENLGAAVCLHSAGCADKERVLQYGMQTCDQRACRTDVAKDASFPQGCGCYCVDRQFAVRTLRRWTKPGPRNRGSLCFGLLLSSRSRSLCPAGNLF